MNAQHSFESILFAENSLNDKKERRRKPKPEKMKLITARAVKPPGRFPSFNVMSFILIT